MSAADGYRTLRLLHDDDDSRDAPVKGRISVSTYSRRGTLGNLPGSHPQQLVWVGQNWVQRGTTFHATRQISSSHFGYPVAFFFARIMRELVYRRRDEVS